MEPQLTEEQLIAQYWNPDVTRHQSHGDAYRFLLRPENTEHWWCQHYQLTKELSEVLLHQQHAQPRQIWQAMSQQMGNCSHCISNYHSMQGGLLSGEYELAAVRPLLEVLWGLDKQRLLAWLRQEPLQDESSQLVLALFEILGYAYYLDDQQLCSAVIEQLNSLEWKVATDPESRFPGFYKLLAHPDGPVRAKALEFVNEMGPIRFQELADTNLMVVLIPWLDGLQQQLTGAALSDDEVVIQSHLIPVADRQPWALVNIWFGLKVLLGLMEPDCVTSVLLDYPSLLTLVLSQACPSADWAQQQQQPAMAVAEGLQPPYPAAEGSMEHKHALGCLHLLLKSCKQELWQFASGLPPLELVQQLQAICWRRTADVGLLKLLVQVMQAMVASLLPYLVPSGVEAEAGLEGVEDDEAPAHDGNHAPAASEAKLAVGTCLRLLLVQLPGSSVMPLLIRALALQAGIDCCTAALQSPSCPGTATFSHLWGPVCADVLYLPSEQQQSPWGNATGGYKQHQAPGLVRLMPLLDQMDELRKKVVGAAADLVALALQVDAAVLQAALDAANNSNQSNRRSLVPGALDTIEVALNNAADFMCSPSLWLALAGCGHSTVSATYTAVAAQLAHLMDAASRQSASTSIASVQQHLDESLVLPNAETVALDSTQHMLYALDYAGWLHVQLMRATVRHMHTCSVRSRFFILPRSARPHSGLRSARGSQPTINALYQQLAESQALPPDNTAVEPYSFVVKSCCNLLLLGGDGPAAAVTAGAELALLSSCGVGVGELGAAVQKQLLAPESTSAAVVVEAMVEAVQEVRRQRLQQVVVKQPQRLIAILQFTQYSLAAANQSGVDSMLPLLASYINEAWQLMTDCISSGTKLLTACKQCMAGTDSRPGSSEASRCRDSHTGPAVVNVLNALMECLPTMWRCCQVLLEQRFEQRRFYMLSLDSQQAEGEDVLLSQGGSQGWPGASQGTGSKPTSAAGDRATRKLQLEIQREMKWMVQLLQLGRQLFCDSGSGGKCNRCCSDAATSKNLLQSWKVAVEEVVRVTTAPFSKAVKTAARELMSGESLSLDKLWMAKLFPSAAPGNLGSSGLGSWPTRLLSPSGAAEARKKPAADAATAAAGMSASTSSAAADDVIVIESDENDEWVGKWLSDEELASGHSTDKEGQLSSEEQDGKQLMGAEIVVLGDSDEEELKHEPERQQQHSWPWLTQQAHQQQEQGSVKTGVTKLLQSSKTLNAAKQQQQQQSVGMASLFGSPADSRAARHRNSQPSDDQFKALLASLDKATARPQQQSVNQAEQQQQAPNAAQSREALQVPAAAAAGAVGHLLSSAKTKSRRREQQPLLASGLQKAQPPVHTSAKVTGQPQQPQSQPQEKAKNKDESVDIGSLWPTNWPSNHDDSFQPTGAAAGSSSKGWGVSRFNFSSGSRPKQKQQGHNLAGLSKADQLRAELLGRDPVGSDRAGAAARSRRGEQAEQERLMGFINEQIAKHTGGQQQQVVQQAPVTTNAEMQQKRQHDQQRVKQLHSQEAELQQQRERQRRLFLEQRERESKERERQERERKEKQQQEQLLKQHLEARRAQEQQQETAAKQAAAGASVPAGVNLISDGALFAQAASSKLAASLQQKRHNVVTLKGGALVHSNRRYDLLLRPTGAQAPGARLLGGPRGPEAVLLGNKYYPPLRLDEVVAELLSWGYLGAVGADNSAGSTAALRNKLLDASGKVPLKFGSRAHYCHVFKGLLLEELRAGLAASYEELVATGGASRREGAGSGSFKCLPLIIDSVQRQSHVHVINARVDTNSLQPWERDSPRTEDFIVITKIQLTSAGQLAADKLPRSHLTGFVVDASVEQPGVRLVTFKVCTASAGSEVMANYWQQLLVVRAQLWCSVVTSLVPNFREFQALAALQQSPAGHRLFSQVLSPQPPSTPPPTGLDSAPSAVGNNRALTAISSSLSGALVSAYNQSQQSAVAACLDRRWPLVLVQGPPGTGKTSAIIGILSALLAAKPNEAGGAAAPANTQGQKASGRRSKKAGSKGTLDPSAAQEALQLDVIPPVRILVCAQSNAAIDELATRLANEGVWGEQGSKRAPAMVRLGRSDATHPSVLMFHVDALADNQVAQQQQQQPQQQQQQHQNAERDSLQQSVRDIKEQLQQVEEQLAALSKRQKSGAHADGTAADSDSRGLREGQQQHQAVHKRERVNAEATTESTGAKHETEIPLAKKQKTAISNPAVQTAGNTSTVVRSGADKSSSDMDVSDGEGPAADRYKRQQFRSEDRTQTPGSKNRSRSSSRDRDRERNRERDRHCEDKHRTSRRGRSAERHRRSRSGSRRRRGGVEGDSRGSRRDRERSSSRHRYPRDSRRSTHRRSKSRDRSSSRSRPSGRPSVRERGSSRDRHSKSPSRHRRQRRRDEDGQQPAAAPASAPGASEQQQQQPPFNAAVSESLLRDQQRSLLAALRTAELELQRRSIAGGGRELERAKRSARVAVINAAEIVMCTLSAAGGDLLHCFPNGVEAPLFDVLVVDEAAQALEPATLIPMQMLKPGTGRVVLVGDPCQLPPTVLSRAAEAALLAQSLFERLARAGWPVTLLREQYRMHPLISAFPSRFFYDGQLVDGAGITAVSKGAKFHSKLAFSPFVMWDCWEGREARGAAGAGGSLRNNAEAQLAAALVAGVLQACRGDVGSIAVISPYKAQVSALRHEFRRALGGDAALAAANIEFGTVDGFQGREADIIVFSCVRAQPEATLAAGALTPRPAHTTAAEAASTSASAAAAGSGGGGNGGGPRVGFLADVRRMNVGLTRGRRAVWVVCHAGTLAASSAWRPLLQEARARGVLLEARAPFNRLMGATDKQLRGSYWTPAAAAPAAVDKQTATAASGAGGHAAGVVDHGVADDVDLAKQSAATAVTGEVVTRKPFGGELGSAAVVGTDGAKQGHNSSVAGPNELTAASTGNRGHKQQQLAVPPPLKGATTGAAKNAKETVSTQQVRSAATEANKQETAADSKLHAALQQRLEEHKLDNKLYNRKDTALPQQVRQDPGAVAGKPSSQRPAVPHRHTAAGGVNAAVRPKMQGQQGSKGVIAGKSDGGKLPNSAAAAGARTAAGAGTSGVSRADKGQQRTQQPATSRSGDVFAGKSAQAAASAEEDRLKTALLRRIQQQQQQKR